MIAFVKAAKIDDDLRRIEALTRPSTADDWRPVASAYNGPKYAKHGYHTRLAKADAKWRKIPDTPWSPAAAETSVAALPPAMTKYEVEAFRSSCRMRSIPRSASSKASWAPHARGAPRLPDR